MGALQRWLGRRREDGFLAGVLVPAYVTLAALAVSVVVVLALWRGLAPGASGGCSLHVGAALSGSSEVFARHVAPGCSELTLAEARRAVAWDFAFIALYAPLASAALWWLWPRAWRVSRLRRLRSFAFVPAAAGAFDVVENAFVLAGLEEGLSLREAPARLAAVAGWWKGALVAAAVLATVACVCGAIGNRRVPEPPRRRTPPRGRAPVRDEIGICLSGGGIRSAAFALGALRGLDRRGLLSKARWIAAISGGAYAAGAWFVGRGATADHATVWPQPEGGVDRLLEPPGEPDLFEYLRANRRYLSTGRGGLPATFVTGGLLVALNVAVLSLLVCLVSWPVGRLAATWAVRPELAGFGYAAVDDQSLADPWRLWPPGVFGLAAAVPFWVVALFLWDPARTRVLRVAAFFAGGGAVLLALLVGAPVAMAETPKAWAAIHSNPLWGAGVAATIPMLGLVAAALWLALTPTAVTVTRAGGALLALLAILLGGRVATDAAYGDGWFSWRGTRYAAVLAAFAVLYFLSNAQSWALFRLYYLRLRSTFATTQKRARRAPGAPGHAGVYPLSLAHEPPWEAYAGRSGPELVVCAAARTSDSGPSRVRASSFTFSPHEVALRDVVVPARSYSNGLRPPGRWGPRLDSVSAAVAMSGAAFTSATANALPAALNLRLGAWMPNPAYPVTERPLKKPRIGYLLKEVFGVYDPDDPYVYVTDGGRRENLGLVELIRRRARWIFCLDADPGEAFAGLEEAMALAREECGAEIVIDTDPLRPRDGRLPKSAVATGVVRFHTCGGAGPDGCDTGLLFYGKAIPAQDSPINTLSFSLRDGLASRGRSIAGDDFLNLVRLGEWVGRGLALDYEKYGPPP